MRKRKQEHPLGPLSGQPRDGYGTFDAVHAARQPDPNTLFQGDHSRSEGGDLTGGFLRLTYWVARKVRAAATALRRRS